MAFYIRLLDTLQIKQDGQPSPVMKNPKELALFFYVLITQKPARREIIADLLWDGTSTSQSLRNLRALLFRLRKHIPQIRVEKDRLTYEARPEDEIDLYRLTLNLDSTDPQKLDQILRTYRADLLLDFYLPDSPRYNEWLTIERESLRQRVLRAYEQLCKIYQKKGHWRAGSDAARRWLELDPYDEEAYYQSMAFLAASGQKRLALSQYQSYCQIQADQFDLEPTPRMTALFENIQTAQGLKPELNHEKAGGEHLFAYQPDWGEAPTATAFWGRQDELAQLESWLVVEHCPVVAILGIGGQGKTTLAAEAARSLTGHFEGVIWRSLLNAPLPGEIIGDLLGYFAQGQITGLPESLDAQLAALGTYLKRNRFLVILDNLESVLSDESAGKYCQEYTDYDRLVQIFSQSLHQSSLLITSRENPARLDHLQRQTQKVRSLHLAGLSVTGGSEMLQHAGVAGSDAEMMQLVERYSGNPLALKLVAQTILDFYNASVSTFLHDETTIFEDIRDVLDQQFNRLSALEQEILIWLAIEREPATLSALQTRLLHSPRQRSLIEAIYSLQRKSLLEKHPHGFGMQNVIIEYLTDHLVERCSQEIRQSRARYLSRFALQPADCREYMRLSQKRRILKPIGDILLAETGPDGIVLQFEQILEELRPLENQDQGYAAGNLLNLALNLGIDPAQFDFSHQNIWQVNLQGVDLPGVNLVGADLSGCIFTNLFGFVYAVAYSPNGQLLAAGSGDGRIHIWWAATGSLALIIEAHAESVWGLAFSPDNRSLASCSADGSVRLWDAYSGAPGRVLKGHPDGVLAVAFHPAGDILVSSGEEGWVCVWDVQTGELRHILKRHSEDVQAITFSTDGLWLATGGRDQLIHLWPITALQSHEGETPAQTLSGHSNWVNALVFSPDGTTLASASEDMTIRLWDFRSGNIQQTLEGHTAGIHALAFSPDGKLLVSGGNDHSVRLWNWNSGQIHHTFLGHTNWVYSLAFSPDGRILASGSWDQSVRLWDVRKHQAMQTYHGNMRWVFGLAFSSDSSQLASGSADKKVRLWDMENGQICRIFRGHMDWVWNVAFTPNATLLVSISMDHAVRLWDLRTGALLQMLREHQDGLQALAISPKGIILATGGLDHSIVVWDIADVEQSQQTRVLHKLNAHTGWCLGLDFSPDGRTLASSSADHTIRLWDVFKGECLRVFKGHTDGVQQVFFNPDGNLLSSASWDKTAIVWDTASGNIIHRLKSHTGILRALAFSPDGQTIATAGNDQTIHLWDVHSGECMRVIKAHDNWVFYLVFSPDGRILASASADETIKLWDALSGRLLQTFAIPGPYQGMRLAGVSGLSAEQLNTLQALGAQL